MRLSITLVATTFLATQGSTLFAATSETTGYNGIEYIITDGTAAAQTFTEGHETAELIIPSEIVIDGKTMPVTAVASNGFLNQSITKLTLSEGITKIGNNSFCKCSSLKEIILPSTMSTIEASSFDYCAAVTEIYSSAITPPTVLGSDPFFDFIYASDDRTLRDPKIIVHVAAEAVTAYKEVAPWSKLDVRGDLNSSELYGLMLSANGCGSLIFNDEVVHNTQQVLEMKSQPTHVTISAVPDHGYEIATLTATDKDGKAIFFPLSHENGDMKADIPYSTSMNVTATFKATSTYALTIKTATFGEMKVNVPQGKQYTFSIAEPLGWTIESVSMNDEPITTNRDTNDYLVVTTPALTEDASLTVNYKEIVTGSSLPISKAPRLTTTNHQINLTNLSTNEIVIVSSTDGTTKEYRAQGSTLSIPHLASGIYIVSTSTTRFKVIL